jgi:hypothetical protein
MARPNRRRGPARWPLVALLVLFAVLGVGTLLRGGGDDDDGGDGEAASTTEPGREVVVTTTTVVTEAVEGDPEPIVPVRRDYALTYRVEGSTTSGGAIIDLEHREVRPPYASRVETVPAEAPDGDPTFVQIARFGELQTGREDEAPVVLRVEPAVAPGDVVVAIDVEAAIAAGVLEWRHEARTILDRRCQVFRTGGPIDVADLAAPAEGEETWADLCIGDDGLLLQEEWVIGGEVFRRRTLVDLDESPSLDDGRFDPDGERPEGVAAGSFAELTPDSRPADVDFYELAEAPVGFTRRGRFGYSPPRNSGDLTAIDSTKVASIMDVYEDGAGGIVVVVNGGSSDGTTTVAVRPEDQTVDLGSIGTAAVVPGVRQNEVHLGFEHGRFLRVYGTLAVADLAALARTLTVVNDPNGTVTPA